MLSLKQEFIRRYLKYLLTDVTVVPIEDFEVETLSKNYRFVVGEEIKIPRWLAKILEKKGKVKIKDETDVRETLGRLPYYIVRESEGASIEIELDLYLKAKEYLEKLENSNVKERIREMIMRFIRIRLPKLLRKAIVPGSEKEALIWEDVLIALIRNAHEHWVKTFLETDLSKLRDFIL
ncbi:MAG: hypothetical protein ACTSX9_02275 [Candidatus Njordarchaeales archaeon]